MNGHLILDTMDATAGVLSILSSNPQSRGIDAQTIVIKTLLERQTEILTKNQVAS
jgi:hypothetical protein